MELLGAVRRVVRVLRENFAPLVAGSLAYSAFVSLPPLLMLVFVAATVLGEQRLVDQALAMTGKYITPTGRDLFAEALRDSTGRATASAFGLLFLLWSGSACSATSTPRSRCSTTPPGHRPSSSASGTR